MERISLVLIKLLNGTALVRHGAAVFTVLWLMTVVTQCGQQKDSNEGSSTITCPGGTIQSGEDCLVDCYESYTRGPDNKCRPPCHDDYELVDGECVFPCQAGMVQDGRACVSEMTADISECPNDLYNDEGAGGTLVYLDQSSEAEVVDGSRRGPYTSMAQVLEALESTDASEVSVLIAPGEYVIEGLYAALPSTVSRVAFLGRCAQDTKWIAPQTALGLTLNSPDTSFELRRLNIQGSSTQIALQNVNSVAIEACSFSEWGSGNALLLADVNDVEIRYSTFSVASEDAGSAIGSYASNVILDSNEFTVFAGDGYAAASLEYIESVSLTDNIIFGEAENAVSIQLDNATDSVTVARNLIDGDWKEAGLRVVGKADNLATVNIEKNTLVNHNTSESTAALTLDTLANITVSDLRIEGGGGYGIRVSDIGNLTIRESTVRDLPKSALRVGNSNGGPFESCTVLVEHSHFEGMGEYAVYHADAMCDLQIIDNIFQDNTRGVWAKAKELTAESNDFAANTDYALKTVQAQALSVFDNIMASNDGTGIDISALNGLADSLFRVEQNKVLDCAGVGIKLQDIGSGTLSLMENHISGTRRATLAKSSGEEGVVGDGISIISNLKSIPSNVEMVKNVVDRNARLGVMAHGQGVTVEAEETSFDTGNGYGQMIEMEGQTPNLTTQNDATVTGEDEKKAVEVEGVFVSDDAPEEENDDD